MTQLFSDEVAQAINILVLEIGLFSWAMLSLIIAVLVPATRKLLINLQPFIYLLLAVIGYYYHWDLQGSLFGDSYLQYSFHIQVKIILLVIASGISYIYLAYCNTTAKLASPEYLVLITLAMFGFFAAISARDLLLLFIALEISSLVQYVLAAYNTESRESTEAGIKYFTIGALSSCVMLLGISYIYGFTGSLSYDSFYHLVNQESSWYFFPPAIFKFAITLVIIGLAFKLSLAPFHFWTPDVYQGSPAASTAFFTTVSKIVIAVVLATILMKVFPNYRYLWRFIIQVIAATSMIVGAFGGLVQTHLKRLFAYSTIMSSGLAMIAVLAANEYGMSAAINYIIVTSLMNLAIFAIIITCLRNKADQATLEDLTGLGYSHKFAGCCMAILMFSYIGIPPFAGFFTKLYLLKAALLSEFYLITIVAVISTVVSAVYYLRIVKMMYLGTSENKLNSSYLASMFLLIILVISFICSYFVYPVFLVEFN